MASRISCLVLTVSALLMAVTLFYSALPGPSDSFVTAAGRSPSLRSTLGQRLEKTSLQAEEDEKQAVAVPGRRPRVPTAADEQYGKPPPTEAPLATSNTLFNFFSVAIGLLLVVVLIKTWLDINEFSGVVID
eukprot:TRINITY_DN499_c0_g1_i1.p2 TRINITY_DN499_c0_g1~~TRINITY_DN499_c0_g1_i1.p2  ORF type:complete len:150 (+),score=26.58 TRINITY_DN499_c0_g1_i1:56-451(+)